LRSYEAVEEAGLKDFDDKVAARGLVLKRFESLIAPQRNGGHCSATQLRR
jgi:hypothetical protein